MITIPIELSINKNDIFNSTSESIESLIKEHIINEIIENITILLDDEHFIEMIPSKDEPKFDIKVDILLGSTYDCTTAINETVSNLLELCIKNNISKEDSTDIILKATLPLTNMLNKTNDIDTSLEQDVKSINTESSNSMIIEADLDPF